MHQIMWIELRNAKFPYTRGHCPHCNPLGPRDWSIIWDPPFQWLNPHLKVPIPWVFFFFFFFFFLSFFLSFFFFFLMLMHPFYRVKSVQALLFDFRLSHVFSAWKYITQNCQVFSDLMWRIPIKGHWTSVTSSPTFSKKKLGFLYH